MSNRTDGIISFPGLFPFKVGPSTYLKEKSPMTDFKITAYTVSWTLLSKDDQK